MHDEQASAELRRAIEARAAELPEGVQLAPQQLANHFSSVMFSGGPAKLFEEVGRRSFISLLENGLYPHSSVLDVGCGTLRIGYWLINFLQPGRYHGLEPDAVRVELAAQHIVGSDVVAAKRPVFDHNMGFDFTAFGAKFDFYVARSIWTHASKAQIATMLDGFATTATSNGVFLASYVPADDGVGYEGEEWVAMPLVHHAIEWVGEQCRERNLAVRQLPEVINDQPWLRIERAREGLEPGLHADSQSKPRGLVGRLLR